MPWQLYQNPGLLKRVWSYFHPPYGVRTRCPNCKKLLIAGYEKYPDDPFAFGPCPACGQIFPLFEQVSQEDVFFQAAKNNNPLPEEILVVMASDNGLNTSSIPKGILFLMAVWSGGARQAFHCLKQVLSRINLDGLKVYVLNVDGMSIEFCQQQLSGFQLGGWGETFWIRDGKIQRSLLKYTSEERNIVEEYTRELLGQG
jgi:hypothetical protein